MKFISSNMRSLVVVFSAVICLITPALGQIQAGKAVSITVQGVPPEEKGRIDGPYLVADNGNINMPFVGQVRAAGLKPEALAAALEARYRAAQIYRSPTFQVVADVEGAALEENVVHLGGQVTRPGPVKYQRGLTLWQAIHAAGGPTPFGTLKRVKVLRGGQQRLYDVTQLEAQQIRLEPSDTIEVPQKRPWDTR
jgi:protein involved in polysaccharide export with SLBB domain